MYLIWRMDTTAKGAKENTSPNVIPLQYIAKCNTFTVHFDFYKLYVCSEFTTSFLEKNT